VCVNTAAFVGFKIGPVNNCKENAFTYCNVCAVFITLFLNEFLQNENNRAKAKIERKTPENSTQFL